MSQSILIEDAPALMSRAETDPAESRAALPEHLIQMPGEEWALWRHVGLRAAGFPVEHVLKLASAECAAAADRLLEAEGEARRAQEAALELLRRGLEAAEPGRRDALVKAVQRMKKGKPPSCEGFDEGERAAVEAYGRAREDAEARQAEYREAYRQAVRLVSRGIREVVGMDSFREALIWQNRRAYHTGISGLLRRSPDDDSRGSKHRQHEELVASYLQRYCVKNDTIGFFGPMGWGKFTSEGETVTTRPGPGLLEVRNVRFEGWAVDAVADLLSREEALEPWMTPRRVPFVNVEETTLHLAGGGATRLALKPALVLRNCDGVRTARELSNDLLAAHGSLFGDEAEVFGLLRKFSREGSITWKFEVPPELYPEARLRRQLEKIEIEGWRQKALSYLDQLEADRRAVIEAAGDPEKLDQAFGQLESNFAAMTGLDATRSAGEMYAGRTLVYEDCRRDLEFEFGPELIESLKSPLALLLTSARWFTAEVAKLYSAAFKEVYDDMVRLSGSPVVDGMSFWGRIEPLLMNGKGRTRGEERPFESLLPVFQERWERVLRFEEGERRVNYTSEELRPLVEEAFDAPAPGWMSACYHSPDVMVVASGVEAMRRGDYQLVMGELHLGTNTLSTSCFLSQHPRPEELFEALEIDLPAPRLLPATPKTWPNTTSRTHNALVSPTDFYLDFAGDTCFRPEALVLPIVSTVIEEIDGELMFCTRDGIFQFGITEACAQVFAGMVLQRFQMLPRANHNPRITIDKVVVCRESWRFPADQIAFAFEKDEAKRFVAARGWAREHDMPRFVFVKAPNEVKPCYVDFDSPIYVDIIAKVIRRNLANRPEDAVISFTEMLPRSDQTWVPDADGQHYTSELRIVAVDQRGEGFVSGNYQLG